jgi:hypothetical protein
VPQPAGQSADSGSQGADDPSGEAWRTYANGDYGFELRYPKNLMVRSRRIGDDESFIVGFTAKGSEENL